MHIDRLPNYTSAVNAGVPEAEFVALHSMTALPMSLDISEILTDSGAGVVLIALLDIVGRFREEFNEVLRGFGHIWS